MRERNALLPDEGGAGGGLEAKPEGGAGLPERGRRDPQGDGEEDPAGERPHPGQPGQQGQEHLPVQYVPRYPYPHERHYRPYGSAAAQGVAAGGTEIPSEYPELREGFVKVNQ